ncbi:MAG TPA: FAD-dependent oxidoreductase, partial [Chryseosolibacter sp.]
METIKRRDFLKTTVSAGVGGALLAGSGTNSMAESDAGTRNRPQQTKKIIVAGAGIAGLCCGYELMRRGFDVVVLEASPRHGGHVFTVHDGLSDGLYADYGAEHITRPGYTRYWEYTKEFNLTVLPYPRRRNILRRIDGKFYSEEMLADPAVLKKFGYNEREVKFLSQNP